MADLFPLSRHPNGQFFKKVRGKFYYFGTDRKVALQRWIAEKDTLGQPLAIRAPDIWTVRLAANNFLTAKREQRDAGELTARSWNDYKRTMDKVMATLAWNTPLAELTPDDFRQVRQKLGQGVSPVTLKNELTRARVFFRFCLDEGMADKLLYRKALKSPAAKLLRQERQKGGLRLFTAKELRELIAAAPIQLRAMIYLGINCGYGNADVARLPLTGIQNGWADFPRPKTGVERRCPLWPETLAAIDAWLPSRNPRREAAELVFHTRTGRPWAIDGANPISREFKKLCEATGCYRGPATAFYTLRRTHSTYAQTAGEPVAAKYIMGHVDDSGDMAAVYRQAVFNEPLRRVTDRVRAWLLGEIEL